MAQFDLYEHSGMHVDLETYFGVVALAPGPQILMLRPICGAPTQVDVTVIVRSGALLRLLISRTSL